MAWFFLSVSSKMWEENDKLRKELLSYKAQELDDLEYSLSLSKFQETLKLGNSFLGKHAQERKPRVSLETFCGID